MTKDEIYIYKERHFELLIVAWIIMDGAWIINGLGFGIIGTPLATIGVGLGLISLVGVIKEANKYQKGDTQKRLRCEEVRKNGNDFLKSRQCN